MARTEVEVHLKPVLDAVTVRPGDTLVVRCRPDATREQAHELDVELKKRLPGVDVIVLVGVDQVVIYKPKAGDSG